MSVLAFSKKNLPTKVERCIQHLMKQPEALLSGKIYRVDIEKRFKEYDKSLSEKIINNVFKEMEVSKTLKYLGDGCYKIL